MSPASRAPVLLAWLGLAATIFFAALMHTGTASLDSGHAQPATPGGTEVAPEPPQDLTSVGLPPEVRTESESAPPPDPPIQRSRSRGRSGVEALVSIQTIEAATGSPLANVSLFYGRAPSQPLEISLEEHLLARGRSITTNAQGLAEVPISVRGTTSLVARRGELYAELSLPAKLVDQPLQPWRMLLAPDWELRVRCIDSTGALVLEVPIAILRQGKTHYSLGSTGATGTLTLPHGQLYFGSDSNSAPSLVFVDRPGAEPSGIAVDPSTPPRETLELILPASGDVIARVLDSTGSPYAGVNVKLSRTVADPTPTQEEVRIHWSRTGAAGRAIFRDVTAGLQYQVVASTAEQTVQQTTSGPSISGEEVVVDLLFEAAPISLLGRAFDSDGEPLFEERLQIAGSVAGRGIQTTTRADGSFRIDLSTTAEGLTLDDMSLTWLQGGNMTSLRADLPTGEVQLGENYLGDLRFAETPLLLAGRIHGAASDLHDVQLRVEFLGLSDEWRPLSDVATFPQGGNRFELRARAVNRPLRLQVKGTAYLPLDPIEFRLGTNGLSARVVRGGSLRAVIQTRRPLVASLVANSAPPPARNIAQIAKSVRDQPTRRTWLGLAAGSYTLRLRAPESNEVLLEIGGLVVPAGGACDDPRLADIRVP